MPEIAGVEVDDAGFPLNAVGPTGAPRVPTGRRGAPPTITPELVERICALLRVGNYPEVACAACGVAKRTYLDWMQRARQGEEPYAELSHALTRAMSDAEVRDVALLAKHSEQYWGALAWRLERRYPDRWGRRIMELQGPGGTAPVIEVTLSMQRPVENREPNGHRPEPPGVEEGERPRLTG